MYTLRFRREIESIWQPFLMPERKPFLRRDRQEGFLLCTNFPLLSEGVSSCEEALHNAGYLILRGSDGLWHMDLTLENYRAIESKMDLERPSLLSAEDVYLQAHTLARLFITHGKAISSTSVPYARHLLKAMDEGDASFLIKVDALVPAAAEALRKKEPIPQLAGLLIDQWIDEKMKGAQEK